MPLTALKLFKNESDETRLGIVLMCRDLAQFLSKISRHQAIHRGSCLLLERKRGKWVHYRLSSLIPS